MRRIRTEGRHAGSPPRSGSPILPKADKRSRSASAREEPGAPPRAVQQVKLVPRVSVKDNKIERIKFGNTRTPSLFGNRMGDHTGSWTSVRDSVHALVHGKPVKEAVHQLRARQQEAQAWRDDDTSLGMKLWNTLESDDRDKREEPLRTYARQVDDLLNKADAALDGRNEVDRDPTVHAARLLSEAIGYHLAYRNLLPYATVPATKARGSTGAGEGAARTAVREVEKQPEKTLLPGEQEGTRENLWKLFSMEAAVRAAGVVSVVAPKGKDESPGTVAPDVEPPKKRGKRELTSREPSRLAENKTIAKNTEHSADRDTGYRKTRHMTTRTTQTVRSLREAPSEVPPRAPDRSKEHNEDLNQTSGEDARNESPTDDLANAIQDGAHILAHLLYEHQRTVGQAYPTAVKKSDFLGSDPAAAAAKRLHDHLSGLGNARSDAIKKLTDRVQELHAGLAPRPTPATGNTWMTDPSTSERAVAAFRGDLVAAFRSDGTLAVQGRPTAPRGVVGHGAHTTAWITEVDAVKQMLATYHEEGIAQKLREETVTALKGELMTKLAVLLPTDQLKGGQVSDIFDAATDVMAAESPEESIEAYLTFRNLLPYATVFAGSPDGQGEYSGAPAAIQFDKESLQAAIDLKMDEFDDSRFDSTIREMEKASELTGTPGRGEGGADSGEEPVARPPRWTGYPEVARAVKVVADAMKATVEDLKPANSDAARERARDNAAELGEQIMTVRDSEHDRVYELAYPGKRPRRRRVADAGRASAGRGSPARARRAAAPARRR
ncbi:hypothetical protein C1I98_30635 [Spongiactinospora gelatinilytica]|uniref:Uncharacterized protein n=1 Tax=Spongiactinospora gelatinilytica TaxID=2666298 RepID=A0A2W2G248_9ACTN|nr:hypothetical protein C1I98_30635 [Spongiactinospora gelatinilytica]